MIEKKMYQNKLEFLLLLNQNYNPTTQDENDNTNLQVETTRF